MGGEKREGRREERRERGREEGRGEEQGGEARRGGAGHQAAVCLDSIHDPSVCHHYGDSQRQQQDGKLH